MISVLVLTLLSVEPATPGSTDDRAPRRPTAGSSTTPSVEPVLRWTDDAGVEHFTNDPKAAPPTATTTEGSELLEVKVTDGEEAPRIATVLLFHKADCPPCKTLEKRGTLDALISANPGLLLAHADYDHDKPQVEKFKIEQLPTVIFIDHTGAERGRVKGLDSLKGYQAALAKARARLFEAAKGRK